MLASPFPLRSESRGDDTMAACGQLGRPDEMEGWKPAPPRTKPPLHMRESAAAAAL